MKVTHRRAPIGHNTLGVLVDDAGKNFFRFGIFKGVEQRGGKVKIRFYFFGARLAEGDGTELVFAGTA